jgi:hypothetical protein
VHAKAQEDPHHVAVPGRMFLVHIASGLLVWSMVVSAYHAMRIARTDLLEAKLDVLLRHFVLQILLLGLAAVLSLFLVQYVGPSGIVRPLEPVGGGEVSPFVSRRDFDFWLLRLALAMVVAAVPLLPVCTAHRRFVAAHRLDLATRDQLAAAAAARELPA